MSEQKYLVDRFSGNPVPLKGILVDITVQHTIAEFRMHQFYENKEDCAIETDFLFSVDSTAAVTDVTLDFGDGRLVEAHLYQKEKGKKKYDDALASGKNAAIAKYSASEKGLIRIGLGNFPPNQKATLTVIWHKKLEIEDLSWCVRLPTTFIPRYQGNIPRFLNTGIPQNQAKSISASEEQRLEMVREFAEQSFVNKDQLTYFWNMKLRIISGSKISRLVCTSHPILFHFAQDGKSVDIQIDAVVNDAMADSSLTDKTFVLYFRDESTDKPQVLLQEDQSSISALISFFPEFIDPQVKKMSHLRLQSRLKKALNCDMDGSLSYETILKSEEEKKEQHKEEEEGLQMPGQFIFLIDRSGSMGGERIALARQSLLLFLASIPPGSRFNVYSFGSNFKALFKGRSAVYDEEYYLQAKEAIAKFDADMGGTQVFQAIKSILMIPTECSLPRHVFLLTDGAVSNPAAVIQLVEQNARTARFHTFGIGDGASEELVRGVAQAGKGNFYFVGDNEGLTLQSKVIDALSKTSYPCLGNVKVELQDEKSLIEMAPGPQNLPILQDRQPLVIFAHIKQDFKQDSNIKLSYENLQTHQKFEHILELSRAYLDKTKSQSISKLFGKQKLAALEFNKENAKECVEISLRYKVLSQFTTFVAEERLIELESGKVEYRKVPVSSGKARYPSDLFVKTLTGKTITGDASTALTIHDMKQQIQDKQGIPIDQIRLICKGRQVNDDEEIDDFEQDSTFHMVLRLRGGPSMNAAQFKKQKQQEEEERLQREEENAKKKKLTKVHNLIQKKSFYVDFKQATMKLKKCLEMLTAELKMKIICPTLWLNSNKLQEINKSLKKQKGFTTESEFEFSYISMDGIISLQKFDGSWSLQALIQARIIEGDKKMEPNENLDQSHRDMTLGTTWGIKILTEEFAEESSCWKLVVKKAKDFLNKQGQNYDEINKFI